MVTVVDLQAQRRLGPEGGKMLHDRAPEMRIVVLTGYAKPCHGPGAIKLGACHYLAKAPPTTPSEIEAAFGKMEGDADVALTRRKTSSRRWSGNEDPGVGSRVQYFGSRASRHASPHACRNLRNAESPDLRLLAGILPINLIRKSSSLPGHRRFSQGKQQMRIRLFKTGNARNRPVSLPIIGIGFLFCAPIAVKLRTS